MKNSMNITHQEREIFNKTFLYSVTILCSFEKEILSTSHKKVIIILKNGGWRVKDINDVGLTFEKGSSFLFVGKNSIFLSIPKVDYQSFEDQSDTIDLICQVQNKLKNIITTTSIIKTNKYNIKHESSKGESWMKQVLFSKDFNSIINENETHTQSIDDFLIITKVHFSCKDGVDTIEYTIITSTKTDASHPFKDKVSKLNQRVFDVWRWSMSENVIKLMRTKEM